jgi:cytochrome P450
MTITAHPPRTGQASPVLMFGAAPGGQYPQVLLDDSCGDTARAPAGGPPMLVLRDPTAVLACIDLNSRPGPRGAPPRIVMAGAHPATGALRGCPLTGAEQQHHDGGLLNMNPPRLTAYRRKIGGLFSASAAESTRPVAQACAAGLVTRLAAASRETDIAARYATPFAAAMIVQTLGTGTGDWPQIKAWSDVAFGVVRSPDAVRGVDAVWAELYAHFGSSRLDGLAAAIAGRLTGHTPDQITHVLATVSNGFGALPPVLIRVLVELLRQPDTVTTCLRGDQSWRAVVRRLIGTQIMFPIALPRLVLADTWLGSHLIKAGTIVLPSLIGAARAGAPATIAFGPGPHVCPGAAWTWAWTEVAVETFFRSFPRARLAGPLDWQPGTLQIPRQARARLW